MTQAIVTEVEGLAPGHIPLHNQVEVVGIDPNQCIVDPFFEPERRRLRDHLVGLTPR